MYYLVVNPAAGRGRAKRLLGKVEAVFAQRRLALTVLTTQAPGHATELVKALPTNAPVLVLGGDGTVHEVAAACVSTGRCLGLLPAGSGDDFAHALDIPRKNLSSALEIILVGKTRLIDTGEVNGYPFVNAFGVGFDADVAYGLKNAPPFLKDQAAYLYSILRTLSKLSVAHAMVEIDGAKVFNGKALLVTVQNGPRTGGSFPFSPTASPSDGLLDVVIAGHFNRRGTLNILPRVMRGNHLNHPKVFLFRGRRVSIHWARDRPGHMEGELLEPSNQFAVKVRPKSLSVFVAH